TITIFTNSAVAKTTSGNSPPSRVNRGRWRSLAWCSVRRHWILTISDGILSRLYPFFTICVTIDRQYTTVFSSIKRMVMLALPIPFSSAIGVFAPVFSRPVWQHVKVLMTGAVLAPGQRTVTAILRIMGRSTAPNFQTYHRVLNRAVWSPLTASRLLLRLLVAVCLPRRVVVCGLDDTI